MSERELSTALRLSLLGAPQIERDGALVDLRTRKAIALLAYLAVTGQVHSREAVATLLWPEYDQARAFANLRRTLWVLNKTIGTEWLDAGAKTVALRSGPGFWLDVDAFRERLTECSAASHAHENGEAEVCSACLPPLTAAVELYHDDFMAGFTLPDSPGFDEWQFFEREGLRAGLASALQRLVRCLVARQDLKPAITYARRWLALDPLHEPAHRELMRLYAWDGQQAAALRQYAECQRILDEELDASPEEETTQLYEAIQARRLPSPPEVREETTLSPVPRHNLPPQPTPFVGREAELAEIARLLQDPDCRLLTLVGPGGVGKSRLALEAATGQRNLSPPPYPHGVYFVPLAPVTLDELIVPTIAAALGFSFYPREGEDPKQQLLNYLGQKQMLLLLDNFEQLVDSADLLSEILERAPALRLLVTSRERLNLQSEWVFEVPGMRYPGEEPVESLEGYSAVQLFLRRASQVDAGFAVPEEEIPDLVRICQLVEGMPLGIELSAAWAKVLSCREIADEIERSLDFLTTAMRDVPDRHRSLRAACDHSWALLSEAEQHVFKKLSVFRGGFQREAAERVAGACLPLLSALVDESLVRPGPSGRYDVHPILQEYAAEKLGANPQAEVEARDRHSTYFMAFLQHREAALKGMGQIKALEEISGDLENVRTAWHWAIRQGKVVEIRKAAPSLWLFYETRSLLKEGEQAFGQAAAALEAKAGQGVDADVALGVALALQGRFVGLRYGSGGAALQRRSLAILRQLGAEEELGLTLSFAFRLGAFENVAEVEKHLRESLAINRKLGRRWETAFSLLSHYGSVWMHWESRVDAEPYLQESYALFREIGDRRGRAQSLMYLAQVQTWSRGLQEAVQYLRESVALFRELGDRQQEQESLDHTGYLVRGMGRYEEARQCHLESLAISREIGDPLGIAGSLDNLGLVAYDLGEYESAKRYFEQGLAIRKEAGHPWSIAISLWHLGDVALARRDYEEAQRWFWESLEVGSSGRGSPGGALKGLGEIASAEGDLYQASRHFRDALEVGPRTGTYISLFLEILVAVAPACSQNGGEGKAGGMAGLRCGRCREHRADARQGAAASG